MSIEKPLKLLKSAELIAQKKLFDEIDGEFLTRGAKATVPTNTDEERAIIKSYQGKDSKILYFKSYPNIIIFFCDC